MKQKLAIGIAINGNEVRAACLSLVRGKACIMALESTTLASPLENSKQSEKSQKDVSDELEKAFNIDDPITKKDEQEEADSESSSQENNVSIVYSLIDKFHDYKTNVAINAPVLTVKYDQINTENISKDKNLKKKIREKIDIWGNDEDETRHTNYINISSDKMLKIDYDRHPPILDLIEEVNQFRAGHLNLVLMDTNELALVDLIREIYKLKKQEITAVIYVEQDFSRVIFLKGQTVYHITPIIHQGSMSKEVLDVIYRKIIYAQDQHFIPELNNIFLACHCSKLKARRYFRQKFPYARTGYLSSKKILSRLRFKDRGLLFSRYAIAIALAWKALQKRTVASKNTNFLPEYLIERQKIPKLAFHGYLLLLLLAISAFAFTSMLISKNVQISKVKQKNKIIEAQIESNKTLADKAKYFDAQISSFQRKIALVDSFSQGYDETIQFLDKLNQSIHKTGEVWIAQFNKQGSRVLINGIAKRRENIPTLSNALGGASVKKVTRAEFLGNKVFNFQMERKIDSGEKAQNSDPISVLRSVAGNVNKRANKASNPGFNSTRTNSKFTNLRNSKNYKSSK
jgi:Tfp pilus assembly protein PilN